MNKFFFIVIVYTSTISYFTYADNHEIYEAFHYQYSGLLVKGAGEVMQILHDENDTNGNQYQKFIIRLDTDLTILIAHNIDASNRIQTLRIGDWVEFYGKYAWSNNGGAVYWTHDEPNNNHVNGWVKHRGVTYR